MFTKSTALYDALYDFKDYAVTVRRLHQMIQERRPGTKSLLDVGCGTGRHLAELRKDYTVEGVDLNPGMIEIASGRCPDVRFHCADMVGLNLGKSFETVTSLFSAIAYVKTLERMEQAIASMARHVVPGGLLLVEPFFTPDNYWTGRITANHVDRPDLKITWMYTSERHDRLARLNIHYLVGRPQSVEYFTELHELGLFTGEEFRNAFAQAGFTGVTFDEQGLFGRGMYIGTKT